jgi:hypothetical protein
MRGVMEEKMEPTILEVEDRFAAFRAQIASEDETRPKMSDAAKAKLRSINERDRLNVEADTRLVKEFTSRPVTVEQLMNLFAKSFGGTQTTVDASPRRRAVKAMHSLVKGSRVYHIHDISLLGELTLDEAEMPRFLARYPLPEDETVTPAGEPVEVKPVRRCALGKKCLRLKNRQAGEVTGKGEYCSVTCRGRAKVVAKLAQRAAA